MNGAVDHLITAVVHFDVVGSDAEDAEAIATGMLSDILEASDLFGDARLATLRAGSPVNGGTEFDATAVVLFRQPGTDPADALAIAAPRLEQEIGESALLSHGAVVFAEGD